MNYKKLNKLILSSLFAAVICVSCVAVHIPVPGGNGYLNISDAFCITAGIILGPAYGAAASALGSALSDILLGYAFYAPATAVIKALIAFTAFIVFRKLRINKHISLVLSSVSSVAVSPLLYFFYEYTVLGYSAAALTNIPFNYLQSGVSAFAAVLIVTALIKAKLTEKLKED